MTFGYKWNETTKYKWTDDMDDVAGKGYGKHIEETCKFAITRGVEFLEEYAKKHGPIPKYDSLHDETKLYTDKKLAMKIKRFIMKETKKQFGDADFSYNTWGGTINHIAWINYHGWDEFVKQLKERKGKEDDET
jgi:hypothetical protein